MRIRFWWSFALLLLCSPAFAEPARLVKDINPGFEPPLVDPSSSPAVFSSYTPVNGRVVFMTLFRDDSVFPQEIQCGLWVTDGTAGGTEKLAELCAGAGQYNGRNVILGTTGAVAFLTDSDSRLWRTDGTAAGTFKLSNVVFGAFPGGGLQAVISDGRTLLFTGCTVVRGCELWKSDGTREGTQIVLDLAPGRQSSSPEQLVLNPGRGVLFLANGALWSSDGTPAGTVEMFRGAVGNVVTKGSSVYWTAFVNLSVQVWVGDQKTRQRRLLRSFATPSREDRVRLDAAGGRVFITKFNDDSSEASIWETDGTRTGTRPLGPPFQIEAAVGQFASVGGRVLFPVLRGRSNQSSRFDLWVLDPSTKRPRQLGGCPGGCPRVEFAPLFTPYKGRLFFRGWDAAHGSELWETDGTSQGTRLVRDLCPGTCGGTPRGLRVVLDRLVFSDVQKNLWVSDGTPAGTVRIAETPFVDVSRDLAPLGDQIVFTGVDPAFGPQPMVSDLTLEGTDVILTLGSGIAEGSSISGLTRLGGKSVFSACDGTSGGVWVSDGTEAGTFELPVGAGPCEPGLLFTYFVPAGNLVFFSWNEKLWRTDGTPAGTVELLDLGPYRPHLFHATDLNGKLLFILFPDPPPVPGPVYEFWTSDGTPPGTRKVFQKILTGSSFRLEAVGDEAFFVAQETTPGAPPNQLWRTDGTEAGTRPILASFFAAFVDFEAVRLNGKTYFLGSSATRQGFTELWVTDGTAAGTQPVIPDLAFPRPVRPMELTVFQGALYFFTHQGVPGAPVGLWRSDGTAAGTRLVRAVDPPSDPIHDPASFPFLLTELTAAGNYLFFRADDGVHGDELWRSDGTPEGTVLVRDIAPGSATSRLSDLTAAGGKLYFAATDVEHGLELWVSDGTADGTRLVDDIQPGSDSSVPSQLTAADGKLFFTANDGVHGREPWVVPVP